MITGRDAEVTTDKAGILRVHLARGGVEEFGVFDADYRYARSVWLDGRPVLLTRHGEEYRFPADTIVRLSFEPE